MERVNNWKVRAAGLLLVVATVWYLPWLVQHLDWSAPWLAIPFAGASILTAAMSLITMINHWHYAVPKPYPVPRHQEPQVAVIVPTYGEPPLMVYQTARSVLEQDYATDKILMFVSDDGHRAAIRSVVQRLQREHPQADIRYHEPPRRGDPMRRGEAKSGNLNSVLYLINGEFPSRPLHSMPLTTLSISMCFQELTNKW